MKRRLWMLLACAALIALLTGCLSTGPRTKYYEMNSRAEAFMAEGEAERALKVFEEMALVAPENPTSHIDLARAHALAGRRDLAFESIDRALELGYSWSKGLEETDEFSGFVEDVDFRERVEAASANAKAWAELQRGSLYEELPAPEALLFESAEATEKFFDGELDRASRESYRTGHDAAERARWDVLNRWDASVRRYLAEKPDAEDREAVAWQRVLVRDRYQRGYWPQQTTGASGRELAEAAEAFLLEYPGGEHADMARWKILKGAWYSRVNPMADAYRENPDLDPEEAPGLWRTEDLEDFLAKLDAFEDESRGSEGAGRAMTWSLALRFAEADETLTEEIRENHEAFVERYGESADVKSFSRRLLGSLGAMVRGIEDFEGIDLAGKTWNRESMKGQVVLIDFWATWCGPCIGEMPDLKKAYEEYHDKGFEIVGVSLDGDDSEHFTSWLEENDVPWPQLYEGEGWDAAMAELFEVKGIPFTLLVNQEGEVVAANLRGEEVQKRVGELLGEE